jgi:hypothetical protein
VIHLCVLAAYFTPGRVNSLSTVDDIPGIGDVAIPDGLIRNTRGGARSRYCGLSPPSTCNYPSIASPSRYPQPICPGPRNTTSAKIRLTSPSEHREYGGSSSLVTSDSPIIGLSASLPILAHQTPSPSRLLAPLHHLGRGCHQRRHPIDEEHLQ